MSSEQPAVSTNNDKSDETNGSSGIRERKPHTADSPANGSVPQNTTSTPTKRSIGQHLRDHFTPRKPVGETPTLWESLRATIMATWLNVLLVFIPVSWAMHFAKQDDTLIFVFSFLAIIPLAKLLGFATEELSLRVGQTIGGLLNATLGNAVELIVAIIALVDCKLSIVQSSLVGSILSNILLVTGMCFFAGGTRFSEQGFLESAAQLNSSLLTISVIAVLLPAAFHLAVTPSQGQKDPLTSQAEGSDILKMSRGVAVILLAIYISYLIFQLWSHSHLYDDTKKNRDANPTTAYPRRPPSKHRFIRKLRHEKATDDGSPADPEAVPANDDEEDVEQPQLSVLASVILLAVVTVLVAVTAEWLVDSIDGLTSKGSISQEWVGLILLPIVGNAAEHVTAVTVSVKDKLTLSLGVAVGSSIQIALFVIPFMTVIAWIMDKPLTLLFDPFQSVVLFLAVLTVNYCIQDGKSNWLEGMILMCLYLIIAVSFWFYPGVDIAQVVGGPLICPGPHNGTSS